MAETVRAALTRAVAAFARFSGTARLDAELLMAHALGITREALLLGRLDEPAPPAFEALLARRQAQEPIAYILGRRDFWTIALDVTPAVLVPRPDSETLIEAAVAHFTGARAPVRILDLGTGSGALLLAALAQWREATGVGIDRSAAALAVAQANAARLGLAARARFVRADWAAGIAARFDLILCNPPYVAENASLPHEVIGHEPHDALFAGPAGLDDYRRLAPQLARLLAPKGVACVEIGADQAAGAGALFAAAGLAVRITRDLGDRDRCLVLTRAA